MNEALKIILSLSLSGTLLSFIILALKPLYKNKLSKSWQYYVWLIVVMRMLIPFTSETTLVGSAFSYFNTINVEITQTAAPAPNEQSGLGLDDTYIAPDAKPQTPKVNLDTTSTFSIQAIFFNLYEYLWVLWLAVALALLVRKMTMYQSFVRFVKAGRQEVSDIQILNMLADAGETVGVKRPVELFVNPLISSPMLLGFFRPCIILPGIELDSTELAYIMRHELIHYKHLDMFYKWLVQMTVCLHWFNPFAYLVAKEINKCCELSCDETIIRTLDKDGKKAYGDTLLNSLKVMGNYNDKLATVTLTEGGEQLKERLDAIMKFRKASKITVTIMLVATLVLTVGATALGAYAATPNLISTKNESPAVTPQTAIDDKPANTPQQHSVSSSGILPDNTKELALSLEVENGGVELLPATSNEISASYDGDYYDVDISNKNGRWNVRITGKAAMMGKTDDVQLYIPNTKCFVNASISNGNFRYSLPDNCVDEISITAQNSGIDFLSGNQYKNSFISLAATNKDFIMYEPPVCPDYFTKTSTGFEYVNGTGANKINISLTGYTRVTFAETPVADTTYEVDSSGKIEIPVSFSSIRSGSEICLGSIPDLRNAKSVHYDVVGESGGSLFVGISPDSGTGMKHSWTGSVESATRNIVWDSGDSIAYSKEYHGDYYIYIQSKYGDCFNITGSIVIEYNN